MGQRQNLKEFKMCMVLDENESNVCQNLGGMAKAMLRGTFTAVNACTQKEENLKTISSSNRSPKIE